MEQSRMSWVSKTDSGLIFMDKTFANCHKNVKFVEAFSREINSLYPSTGCLLSTILVVAWNWQGCLLEASPLNRHS